LGDVLLRVSPSLYLSYFESLVRRAEWRVAEKVLDAYIERGEDGPEFAAVTRTLFEGGLLHTLRKRAEPDLRVYASNQFARLGREEPNANEAERRLPSDDQKDVEFLAEEFPPERFDALLEMLGTERHSSRARVAVNSWFAHWARHSPAELLNVMERYFERDEEAYAFTEIPDATFDLALRLVGREGAYRWLVRAQIHQHGWESNYSSGEHYRVRMAKLVTHYPDRWSRFIQDTSWRRNMGEGRGTLVMGAERVVEFLVLARQVELAEQITESLVSLIESELVEQPLPMPDWLAA
jgi:hypothetical protein